MFCNQCGNELQENAIFCSKCGNKFENSNKTKTKDRKGITNKKKFLLLGGIAIGILIIPILFSVFFKVDISYECYPDGTASISQASTGIFVQEVQIPSKIKENGVTYTVVSVGNYAFRDCDATHIILPNTITSIEQYAFSSCSATRITLPDAITYIGEGAFSNCANLTEITVPHGLTSIADYTFGECHNLRKVSLPDTITSIGDSAFLRCQNLTTIDLPDSLTHIDRLAFQYCKNLTSIDLPENMVSIGSLPFLRCDNLILRIPEHLKDVEPYASIGFDPDKTEYIKSEY